MRLPENFTRNLGRKLLKTRKNSPHIMFAVGIAGVITSAVLACRATLKLEEAVDEIREDFESVKIMKSDSERGILSHKEGTVSKTDEYAQNQYYKDLAYVYWKGVAKISVLYGPPVIIGTASIGLLTGSHVQLARRNQALTVTLAAVSKAYDEYRSRVQDEIGKERELDIYHGTQTQKLEGSKELVPVKNSNGTSIYSVICDRDWSNYKPSSEINRFFVQCQQEYANHLLRARGHVFLNDVYDALGFDRTVPGSVVGWVKNGEGDGYIDFGVYDAVNMRYLDEYEFCLILDFNVDGVIYNLIEEQK
jgi:hypothetical protein